MSKWSIYHFTAYEADWLPSNAPGCYAIYGEGKLVYIGQSEGVKKRLDDHGINFARYSNSIVTPWGRFESLSVKVRKSERYGDWAMIELRMIRKLQPSGNRRGVRRLIPVVTNQ